MEQAVSLQQGGIIHDNTHDSVLTNAVILPFPWTFLSWLDNIALQYDCCKAWYVVVRNVHIEYNQISNSATGILWKLYRGLLQTSAHLEKTMTLGPTVCSKWATGTIMFFGQLQSRKWSLPLRLNFNPHTCEVFLLSFHPAYHLCFSLYFNLEEHLDSSWWAELWLSPMWETSPSDPAWWHCIKFAHGQLGLI